MEDTIRRVVDLDDRRKDLQTKNDALLRERNELSGEIGKLFKAGRKDEATAKRERVGEIKDEIAAGQASARLLASNSTGSVTRANNVVTA